LSNCDTFSQTSLSNPEKPTVTTALNRFLNMPQAATKKAVVLFILSFVFEFQDRHWKQVIFEDIPLEQVDKLFGRQNLHQIL